MRCSVAVLVVLAAGFASRAEEPVRLTLDPATVVNRVDEKVYGHFLEHIYNSCNGGLWGELVWNRSFELNAAGLWSIRDGRIVQEGLGVNNRLVFGDPAWTDYEFTLEALKTGGQEGFLILFRVGGEKDFYWANLGGWGNKRHQLERGRTGEERWHGVGPSVDGAIQQGRWYRISVRCEGRRIQVSLDDRKIIDFTDDARAQLRGAVGVGTWATQAQFRNLRVATLDGKTLYQGLPEILTQPATAKYWKAYGPGKAHLDTENSLNSRFSQRLTGQGGETGLEQRPFCVRRGETYRGSLWARGRAEKGLIVRLLDGPRTIAEATLPAPADPWREFPFVLKPSQDADDAVFQVGVLGKSEAWIDQVSLMPDSWAKAGGFRPDLLEAVAGLRPPVIRWPGGCFASAYRWKDGIGPQHQRRSYPIEIWDDRDTNSFGTDEFVAMCRKVGAEPLLVVNIGTPAWRHQDSEEQHLQDVVDWIEYCNGPKDSPWGRRRAANGHPEPYGVKYWEIDNETWHMGAEAYAEAVRKIAPRMRKADPSIRLAACGSAGYDAKGIGLPWNRVLIERCAELIDYLSIHHYENPDQFAAGPTRYEEFFRKTGELIRQSKNPRLRIYVSEWNAQSTDWRTGLYAGGLLNAFERCGDVLEMGGPALFLRHVSARDWDNAFVNFDHRRWFPAPNYVVMKLWREHYAPDRIAVSGESGPLSVVATRSPDGKTVCLKAVNPSDKAVAVELNVKDFAPASAAMQRVAPDSLHARNTLENPQCVRPVESKVQIDGRSVRFSLPRWSAAVVALKRG